MPAIAHRLRRRGGPPAIAHQPLLLAGIRLFQIHRVQGHQDALPFHLGHRLSGISVQWLQPILVRENPGAHQMVKAFGQPSSLGRSVRCMGCCSGRLGGAGGGHIGHEWQHALTVPGIRQHRRERGQEWFQLSFQVRAQDGDLLPETYDDWLLPHRVALIDIMSLPGTSAAGASGKRTGGVDFPFCRMGLAGWKACWDVQLQGLRGRSEMSGTSLKRQRRRFASLEGRQLPASFDGRHTLIWPDPQLLQHDKG